MTTKCKLIGFRMTAELETLVIKYANEHKWTKSFAICEILKQFFKENRVSQTLEIDIKIISKTKPKSKSFMGLAWL